MTPRFSSPLPKPPLSKSPLSKSPLSKATLSKLKNRFSTKQARLALGAAATVAVVAGVAIGASASPTPAALPTALNHAGVVTITPPAGSPVIHPPQVPAGIVARQSTAANGPAHQPVHVKLALDKHARGHATAAAATHTAAHSAVARHTVAHHGTTHHGTTQHGATRHGAAKPRHEGLARHPFGGHRGHLRHHRAIAAGPAAPYLIYDSTTPSAIPTHHVAAAYATGNYAASPSQLAGKGPVVWIDTTGNDPAASALDVEPGDATPSLAANWALHRLSERPHALARIYTMRSEWPAVQSAVAGLPHNVQARIRWWIADPTGVPHIVPGSAATQWYWGTSYDITTATPRF